MRIHCIKQSLYWFHLAKSEAINSLIGAKAIAEHYACKNTHIMLFKL